MNRNFLIDFFKQLEAAIPPSPNCHHVICYAQYGSDEDGWEDRLAVKINQSGEILCFFIESEDEEKSVAELVRSFKDLLP